MSNLEVKQEEIERLNLRSEEVREIMGQVPARIIRYGITVMLAIVLLILVGACVFRFPDTITAHFVIRSSNPSITLLAKSSGHIVRLNVKDREKVKKGNWLAVISSTADYKHVVELKSNLEHIDSVPLPYINTLKLGSIQTAYTHYGKALNALQDYQTIDYIGTKIKLIEAQLLDKREQIKLYCKAELLGEKTLKIEKSTYSRSQKIYSKGGLSLAELEQYETRVIQAEAAHNTNAMARSQAATAILQTEQEIYELKMQKKTELCKLHDDLSTALENLKAAIREWENNYCLITTIDGIVSFSSVWKENQNVFAGESLMSVVPEDKNEIVARIYIPVNGAGKLRENNRISLSFDDYPEAEYGVLHSKLGKLSLMPDSLFNSTLSLPDTLISNYGKVLPFHQNMTGKAIIITDDISLLVRLVNPLRLALSKYRFTEEK